MPEQILHEDRIVTSEELALELSKTEESVFKSETGLPTLDRILEGVEAGELIVVTGPTGEGKTTLLMSITKNMAEKKIDSVWFTLEVTSRQFLNKLLKGAVKLPMFFLPRRGFDDVSLFMVKQFEIERNRQFQMIDWIEIKIMEAIERSKTEGRELKVVFIDHIHQIFSLAKVEKNISLELGDMVAKIKQIAIKNNLVIFLIAHSRDDSQNPNREPRKEDIRDSGLISRLADTIIGVWRIPNSDDGSESRRKVINETDYKSKIRIFKNRRTGKLGFFVAYHLNHYLTETDGQFEQQVAEFF
jgi:replicative DNA helicase